MVRFFHMAAGSFVPAVAKNTLPRISPLSYWRTLGIFNVEEAESFPFANEYFM